MMINGDGGEKFLKNGGRGERNGEAHTKLIATSNIPHTSYTRGGKRVLFIYFAGFFVKFFFLFFFKYQSRNKLR